MQANRGDGVAIKACNIGIANAAVFPDPVCARPIMSRPARASGIAAAWIGVGWSYFRDLHAVQSSGMIPRDSNDVEGASANGVGMSEGIFIARFFFLFFFLFINM